MKSFTVLASNYSAKQLGEIDLRALRPQSAYRYRQDIFPVPEEFNVTVAMVVPEIVSQNHPIYPYRLKLTVYFPNTTNNADIEKYRNAIESKVRLFNVAPVTRTPTAQPVRPQRPQETPATSEAANSSVTYAEPVVQPSAKEPAETGTKAEEKQVGNPVEKKKRGRKKKNDN